MNQIPETSDPDLTVLAGDIVSAYVSRNSLPASELPALLISVHAALAGLGSQGEAAALEPDVEKATPAQIRKSITPDALISFVDGKPYKSLKRHLGGHGLTIGQYRERYGLPANYPSVSANYSAARSALAKSLGLGQQRRKGMAAASAPAPAVEVALAASETPKRGRPRKVTEPA